MPDLRDLDNVFDESVAAQWPTQRALARFVPHLNLSLGDLGSNFCLRLAALLRRDPVEVARSVIDSLSETEPFSCVPLRGFINVRFNNPWEWWPNARPARARAFIAVAPMPGVGLLGQLRLCSFAFLQAALIRHLGWRVSVFFGGEIELSGLESTSVVSAYRQLIRELEHRAAAVVSIGEEMRSRAEQSLTLWCLAPHRNCREMLKRYSLEHRQISAPNVTPDWIDPIEGEVSLGDFEQWSDSELWALLFHLTGDLSAHELDFTVPRSAETANSAWLIEKSVERGKSLLTRGLGCEGAGRHDPNFAPGEREILLRSRFLETFVCRAGVEGEVIDFRYVLDDLLRRFTAYLNQPARRARIAGAEYRGREREIIAGAAHALSDIMSMVALK